MSQLAYRPYRGLRVLIAVALMASFVVAGPAVAEPVPDDPHALPGVVPGGSPFEASVTATDAPDARRDVYRFTLAEGQFLSIDASQTSEATASVALYGPGTTDPVDLANAISSATLETTGTGTFHDDITAHPGQAGDYYLDIVALSGDSTLTVNYAIGTPSFSLDTTNSASTVVTGSPAGDVTFKASWGALGSEPVTFTAETDQPWLTPSPATGTASSNSEQTFTLGLNPVGLSRGVHEATATVTIAGVEPKPFRVSLRVLDKPTMSISTSTTKVSYGGRVTITGSLRDSASQLVTGQPVALKRSYDRSTWTTVTVPVSTTGNYSVTTPVYRNTYFRWFYAGGGDFAPAESSPDRLVYSYAYVTRPSIPTHISPGKTYTFKGYLKPQHAKGSASITLYWEYYSTKYRKWRKQASMPVAVSDYSNYSVYKYKDRYGRGVPRRWRVKAVHPKDASHLTTSSSWEYYKVY